MPPSAGLPRFDHRADVTGLGLVALALVLGRPLHTAEFPNQLTTLVNEAREQSSARVRSLKQILFKLEPRPPAQPFSPPKVSAPPDAKRGSTAAGIAPKPIRS